MWGTGFTTVGTEYIMAAYAINRILEYVPNGVKPIIIVKGVKAQLGYISKSDDGKKSDGKTPYKAYELLKPIEQAHKRGDWILEELVDRIRPSEQKKAKELALAALVNTKNLEIRCGLLWPDPEYGMIEDDSTIHVPDPVPPFEPVETC